VIKIIKGGKMSLNYEPQEGWGERLAEEIKEKFGTYTSFSEESGIFNSTISRHIKGEGGINMKSLRRYEEAGIDIHYVTTGIKKSATSEDKFTTSNKAKADVVRLENEAQYPREEKKISIPFYLHPVSAGSAVPIAAETPASYEVPASRVRQGAAFAVRASGESMVSVGIVPDSVLICERVNCDAEELVGRLVIASNGWGTVVKILARGDGGRLVLRSANSYRPTDYPDLPIDEDVTIQGVVLYVETDHRLQR
jgi:SOS-response transcriptional repressor LexA